MFFYYIMKKNKKLLVLLAIVSTILLLITSLYSVNSNQKKIENFFEKNKDEYKLGQFYPNQPPEDNIYVIYSISNSPYMEWQADLLDYSFKKSKQPGTLIRLCSDDEGHKNRKKSISKHGYTLFTPSYAVPAPGKHCATLNKCFSIDFLMNKYKFGENSMIIFLDPDMIFVKPWNPYNQFSKGTIYGQKWKGYGYEYCKKTSVDISNCPKTEDDTYMFPFAIMASDLKKISNEIATTSKSGFLKHNDWMVDMTAFLTVPIKHNMKIKAINNIGLCGDWDNANDESAPIMHYCQPILNKKGDKIWYKQDYKANDDVADPNEATNAVGKNVLKMLKSYLSDNNFI